MTEQQETPDNWEKETLKELIFATLKEQRSKHRWGVFFKLTILAYIIFITVSGISSLNAVKEESGSVPAKALKHTALVEINDVIAGNTTANADVVGKNLENAFKHKGTVAVILKINSPGGSPVQARRIYGKIRNLRLKYPDIKLYAVIEELGTSAAYIVASAADAIYADKTSLVGSIGVKMEGFGFVEAMKKLGVERRLYVAGNDKGMLDPFSPRNPEQEKFITKQLTEVHKVVIKDILEARPHLAKKAGDLIFSGKFWIGKDAKGLGLIDEYGDIDFVAREVIQVELIRSFTSKQSWLASLLDRLNLSMTSFWRFF